jgi:AcrR family transcriptional regulator
MTKLKRRSTTDQDKAERKLALQQAARALFEKKPIKDINVIDIVTRCKLAKGTFYLYYTSKEEIFLDILCQEFANWTEQVKLNFAKTKPTATFDDLAPLLLEALKKHELLLRLLPMLHVIIEQNVSDPAAAAFKRFLLRSMQSLVSGWCRAVPGAKPELTLTFLLQAHALLIGSHQVTSPPDNIKKLLADPELQPFDLAFWPFFTSSLHRLAQGYGVGKN